MRKHTKGKGDLTRKKTHKVRSNMGMSSTGQQDTLGGILKNIITGKEG